MATGGPAPKNRANSLSDKPARSRAPWWHKWERALLYPAVLVALVTAGPQWMDRIQAYFAGTPAPKPPPDPQDMSKFWVRNLTCASAPAVWFDRPGNVKMTSTICDSGDVLVHAATPGNDYFKWVPFDQVIPAIAGAGGGGLIPAAHAATLMPTGVARIAQVQVQQTVICQRFLNARYLLRRLRTPQGCVDQTIDMSRGMTASTRPNVPCIPHC